MDVQVYHSKTNVPHEKRIAFKFTVDGASAPALVSSPRNAYVTSVVRVSQGLFRLTLVGSAVHHVHTAVALNVAGAGVARWAQPGPIANVGTSTPLTVDILIVDNAGAVQDPAAAVANNFVSGEIVLCDTAGF